MINSLFRGTCDPYSISSSVETYDLLPFIAASIASPFGEGRCGPFVIKRTLVFAARKSTNFNREMEYKSVAYRMGQTVEIDISTVPDEIESPEFGCGRGMEMLNPYC